MLLELVLAGAVGGGAWLKSKAAPSRRKPKGKVKRSSLSLRKKYARVAKDFATAITSEERGKQLLVVDSGRAQEVADMRRNNQRNLILSGAAVGVAGLGMFLPGLTLVGAGAVAWLMWPIFKQCASDLRRGRISTFVLDAVFLLGMLYLGFVFLAALLALFTNLSIKLLRATEAQSRQRLVGVFDVSGMKVWVEKDGAEIEVAVEEIKVGDVVVVSAGEVIPIDGEAIEGAALIDQHMLTGESQPVEKGFGDKVFAATMVQTGRLRVAVTTAGTDSAAAQIAEILNNTGSYAGSLTARGQKISDDLVLPSLLISGGAWALLGPASALAVLYVPLGCDMRVTGPLAVMNFLQILSRKGVLIKEGRALEVLSEIDTVVFDKTGTLTEEQPTAGALHVFGEVDEAALLRYAAAAEQRQPHPIARAIMARAAAAGVAAPALEDASYDVGYGVRVTVDGKQVLAGSRRLMTREGVSMPQDIEDIRERADTVGFSLVYFAVDGALAGVIELEPTVRPEAVEVICALKDQGKQVVVISGDNEPATRHMAERLGVDEYFAETLPEQKAEHVRRLRDAGRKVCFVGDGVNDAVALRESHVGVSLRGATSLATDVAEIVLMSGDLRALPDLFALSGEFETTMDNNFYASVGPGAAAIGGVFLLRFTLVDNILLRYAGMLGGLANTMLPLAEHQDDPAPDALDAPHHEEVETKSDAPDHPKADLAAKEAAE